MEMQNNNEPQKTEAQPAEAKLAAAGDKLTSMMPKSAVPQINIGSTISRSLSTMMKKPAIFLGLTAIAALIPALIQIATFPSQGGQVVSSILGSIIGMIIQATVAYAVFQIARGQAVSFSECFSRATGHFVPILLASILVGLLVGLGMVLLIIPGVIISCILAVTLPACVVEKLGAVDSLKRSAELTKGNRLQIFLLYLVVGVIIGALTFLFALILFGVTGLIVGTLLLSILLILPMAFSYVMASLIYFDLREIKEGVSLDSLAAVFD
jgi:uncharacterized membrane protein